MAGPGRPTKFTPAVRRAILKAIGNGNTYLDAAECAGISKELLRQWIKKGKSQEPDNAEFLAFFARIKKAKARARMIAVRNIRAAGRKQWQAFAWWLERMYPEDWGDHKREIRELLKDLKELRKMVDEHAERNGILKQRTESGNRESITGPTL